MNIKKKFLIISILLIILLSGCKASVEDSSFDNSPVVSNPIKIDNSNIDIKENTSNNGNEIESSSPVESSQNVVESNEPIDDPIVEPSVEPTDSIVEPSSEPTNIVVVEPSDEPTVTPMDEPTFKPTYEETPTSTPIVVTTSAPTPSPTSTPIPVDTTVSPAVILKPEALGIKVERNSMMTVDYSNTSDGYVMCKFNNNTDKRLKVQITGPNTTYTYNLKPCVWETFVLSDGNGSYKVSVFENVEGTKYSTVGSVTFSVNITDEFAPYLRPNQYVNYENAPNTMAKGEELCKGASSNLDKVSCIYTWVVENFTYDKALATSVETGYLPNLDNVLSKGKGICFDYAALTTAMLRSQGVPTKLIVGYAGTSYHAWISVWSSETGWVEGIIYFDGSVWKRMDPTFASSSNQSESIMKYIGDDKNYSEKYFY